MEKNTFRISFISIATASKSNIISLKGLFKTAENWKYSEIYIHNILEVTVLKIDLKLPITSLRILFYWSSPFEEFEISAESTVPKYGKM